MFPHTLERQAAGRTPDLLEQDLQPLIKVLLSHNRHDFDRFAIDAKIDAFTAEHAAPITLIDAQPRRTACLQHCWRTPGRS